MDRRKVLIVAYHYPPSSGSSGIQRTLKFSAYMREFGWEPMVLTISPRAYEQVNDGQLRDIPQGMVLHRAFGLDAARHLAIRRRYLRWIALPDRWASWWPAAVWSGMRLIREHRPSVIMSTYPIATAHRIAETLRRFSGLPWVADFRDAMTEPGYPRDPMTWASHRRQEGRIVRACVRAVFTTQGTLDMYAKRYPELPESRWSIIENGFDEENFREAEAALDRTEVPLKGPLRLLHSGILYPQERDPRPLFEALRRMKTEGKIDATVLRLILRATGSNDNYRKMVAEFGIEDIVAIEPIIPYREALTEMLSADGLLIMQALICNHQIPAKLYEYARAGRPILGLTDPAGNTADLLRDLGCQHIADIADSQAISEVVIRFIADWRDGQLRGVARAKADACSRHSRTRELAALLDQVAAC